MTAIDTTHKPTTTTIVITPETAKRWLATNRINRPMNKKVVNRYRGDMINGLWQYTHAGIAFDTNGDLVDGQHRLAAIAGLPEGHAVAMSVTRGLAPEARFFVDQGRKRTPGNQLAMAGVRNHNRIAAGIRVYLNWATRAMFTDSADQVVTAPRIQEWAADNAELVNLSNVIDVQLSRSYAHPRVARAAFFALAQIDEEEALDFFYKFSTGADLPMGNPILVLRNRLENDRISRVVRTDREQLGMIFRAWNAVRKGETLQRIMARAWTAETFPEPI